MLTRHIIIVDAEAVLHVAGHIGLWSLGEHIHVQHIGSVLQLAGFPGVQWTPHRLQVDRPHLVCEGRIHS